MCLLRDDKNSSLRHHHCLVNICGELFENNCLFNSLCTFWLKGFFVHDPELMDFSGPNVKTEQGLATNIAEQSVNKQNLINQRIKSNKEKLYPNIIGSVIKMLVKKLANCRKLKEHTHLIADHSQEFTFVKPSFARNLALHGKINNHKTQRKYFNEIWNIDFFVCVLYCCFKKTIW